MFIKNLSYDSCKYIFEFIFSFLILLLLFPIFIIISILIRIDSKGPIIHKRLVIGKDGKNFYFYKFRTMMENADKMLEDWKKNQIDLYRSYKKNMKLKKDPRTTSLGNFLRKCSLDELPQFINILKGEMSLIGPRPISIDEIDKFSKEELTLRNTIKPGITGYWQVNGRQQISYEDRIKADIHYINNYSLKLDLIILIKTIFVIFSRKGAF